MKELLTIISFLFMSGYLEIRADDTQPAPRPSPQSSAKPESGKGAEHSHQENAETPTNSVPGSRTSSLNFEDEIVEGMNKNPFDSVTNIYKKGDREQRKLYRKKQNFNFELKSTIREMGLLQ